jgi:hypothetical protein
MLSKGTALGQDQLAVAAFLRSFRKGRNRNSRTLLASSCSSRPVSGHSLEGPQEGPGVQGTVESVLQEIPGKHGEDRRHDPVEHGQ